MCGLELEVGLDDKLHVEGSNNGWWPPAIAKVRYSDVGIRLG